MEKFCRFVLLFLLLFCQANCQDEHYNKAYKDFDDNCHRTIEGDRLKFTDCKDIERMAKIIAEAKDVSIIDISHLNLQSIDAINLEQNRKLKKFIASHNKLSEFPSKVFSKAPAIEEIDLSSNQLTRIELNAFQGLSTLTALNFSISASKFHENHGSHK